ncbi:hypothetical protein [Burkholderia territorii]|uniref:hypothetical protein n=1 Tax=Burkholderia territorii TaxID=1503055 RepID=UPI000752A5BB|nr:hypothetical protein [Burkholderia territorii]KWE25711.1 hypothetical protein WT49_02320 [Burkholderia territorii]KWE39210.1 hypothetical protein WT50_18375 [Burkholderia territorii]KWE52802.1 hypothetical protein WT51_08680 [Burkholderia territorii]
MPEVQETKTSKPVKVYCKLPHGIVYNLPGDRSVRLIGMYGDERSDLQVAGMPGRDSVAGHGVTLVDADDWEQIVKDHGKSAAHMNGFVFAAKDDKSGEAQAREQEGARTGFEPYDPSANREDKTVDGTKTGAIEK